MTDTENTDLYLIGWQRGLQYCIARLRELPERTPTENAIIDKLETMVITLGQMLYWRSD